jgi:hypothetical protein
MKKTFLLILVMFCLSEGLFAQKKKRPDSIKKYSSSMLFGANYMIKSTWNFNKNYKKWGENSKVQPGFGSSYGVAIFWYANNNIGIGINPSFTTYNLKWTGLDSLAGSQVSYESGVKFTGLDFPIYAKYMLESGAYFELGFQYGMLFNAEFKSASTKNPYVVDKKTISMWNNAYYAPIIGFGFDMYLAEDLFLNGGIRFAYGINNMRGHDGIPLKSNGQPGPNSLLDGDLYDSKNGSHFFWGGVNVGILYRIDI